MSLLAIAYPQLSNNDFDLIQNYRKQHDRLYYDLIKPHFTLVFPVSTITPEKFIAEIKKQLEVSDVIDFSIRCATINKDVLSNYYHTFLVPDEGYSSLVKLHDKLYSDKFADQLRLDIDYIPHITIGNSTDPIACKKMADEWNSKPFEIKGTIASIDIVSLENKTITTIEQLKLNPNQ